MADIVTDKLEAKLSTIENIVAATTTDPDDRERLRGALHSISRQLSHYEGSDALETFLVEFVETAKRGELANDDDPQYRPELERALELETLCECERPTCKVKNGQLPAQLRHHGMGRYRQARAIEVELDDYLRDHPEARVLQAARQAWVEWRGDIQHQIRVAYEAAERARSGQGITDDLLAHS